MAHSRLCAVVASVLLCGVATPARAQREDETRAGDAARKRVLFLLPSVDEATQSELRDALLAQFALLDAQLMFEPAGDQATTMAERMADAQRRAEARDAVAVFWIDAESDDRWFVHMMDSERDRIVVRPVDATGDRRSAAIEAVAVMARESTRALLEGVPQPDVPEPEQAEPPPPAPATPAQAAPPAPAPARARPLRLAFGYTGSDVADTLPFRHGVAIGADWLGFAPFYAGAGYVFTPPVAVAEPVTVTETAEFELQPLPLLVRAGYRSRFGRLTGDLELGFAIEILSSGAARQEAGLVPDQVGTKWLFGLAPRVRGEVSLVSDLSLFLALGAEIFINNFSYIAEDDRAMPMAPRTLLRGRELRPVVELGIAFYP